MNPSHVCTSGDKGVVVKRSFSAPIELVWQAYTEPDFLRLWCNGPPGWSMPICEMDVRVGGSFCWRWKNEKDGTEFGFKGDFLEVIKNQKIVHTQHYDAGDLGISMGMNPWILTVEFSTEGENTLVTTSFAFASTEDRDAAMNSGMTGGMEVNYKQLDRAFESMI